MSIPSEPLPVPDRVVELARGACLTPVWENGGGGVTFRTDDGRYIKYGPLGLETTMDAEALKLAWAHRWIELPDVLDHGSTGSHEWMVTRALKGESAVSPLWIDQPEIAVRAIGAGLRAVHDALPVSQCDWSWMVSDRIAQAEHRGIDVPAGLRNPPEIDQLVVCHGDACAPNFLIDSSGRWSGCVDLGALGIADRWADISVAAMSTTWNYGPGWEESLVTAYGLEPDASRMAFYQALWNAT